jgi:AcrR family transcriptional regulator
MTDRAVKSQPPEATQPLETPARRRRDPERTKQEILEVATQEFADRGFAGARVDEIANKIRTTKRMIYYYFGSKEGLYIAVLELAYDKIRITEQSIDVDNLDPISAVRRLAELTFDRHEANPNFSLHMMISSFCFFRINNHYTFAANFGRDLVAPGRRSAYREMIGDVVVQYLTSAR